MQIHTIACKCMKVKKRTNTGLNLSVFSCYKVTSLLFQKLMSTKLFSPKQKICQNFLFEFLTTCAEVLTQVLNWMRKETEAMQFCKRIL